MAKLWAALLLACPPATALAQEEPLVTDRPDFTESASVPGAGKVQVEAGWTVEGAGGARVHSLGEILVRIGVGGRFEVRLAPGSYVSSDRTAAEDGLDDGGIGFKVLLPDIARPLSPAVAILVSSSVPSGEEEIGASGWQPEARISLASDLSERWSLGVNGGWARPFAEEERFDQALGSVAVGRVLTGRLGAFAEFYGLNPASPGGDGEAYLDGGLTFALGPAAQLDLRAGAGLTDDSSDWLFGLGFARRW